jgi:hypothetical protein
MKKEKIVNKDIKCLNFKDYKKLSNEAVTLPQAQEIPTLISEEAFKAISEGDGDPYFIIEAIEFPVEGDGGIYTKSFFESFINKMREHPFGGSKDGHYNYQNDFYTIGGRVDLRANDEGTAYFKIYVPKMDAQGVLTGNLGFIRDCKAGYVNFSLTTLPEYIETEGSRVDEFGIPEPNRLIVGTMGEERNDSVGWERGRMPQRVNAKRQNEIMQLIKNGDYFIDKTNVDAIIQNGKVSRNALEKIISKGSAEDFHKKAIGLIDKLECQKKNQKKTTRSLSMEKRELLEAFKNAFRNNAITLNDVAQEAGVEDQIKTKEDDKRAQLIKSITDKLEVAAEDILSRIEELLNTEKTADEVVADGVANEMAGRKVFVNANGIEEIDPCFEYIKDKLKGKHGKALENARTALKNDRILLALRSKQYDANCNKSTQAVSNNKNDNTFREV